MASIKPPGREDLIYSEESPDFCNPDRVTGSLGTAGRVCNSTSPGVEGCELLCCGRGYETRTTKTRVNCHCRFKWCCEVTCKICTVKKHVNTCRWSISRIRNIHAQSSRECDAKNGANYSPPDITPPFLLFFKSELCTVLGFSNIIIIMIILLSPHLFLLVNSFFRCCCYQRMSCQSVNSDTLTLFEFRLKIFRCLFYLNNIDFGWPNHDKLFDATAQFRLSDAIAFFCHNFSKLNFIQIRVEANLH